MILIIAAMQEEVSALLSVSDSFKETNVNDVEVYEGMISNKEFVLALSGVGLVNASYTTTLLVNHYKPSHVLNIGSAGGLLETQNVGDICVASSVRTHDLDIGETSHLDERFIALSNESLQHLALEAIKSNGLKGHLGLIVSGDQFITHGSYALNRIHTYFNDAVCVEMEGYAIGMVCKRLNVPFLVLRSLSDVPLKKGNELEFEEYLPLASKNSAQICRDIIHSL